MTKAMTNVDTAFIENLTAMPLHQIEMCEMLAEEIDTPEAMCMLQDIYTYSKKIKLAAINQRDYIRSNHYANR